MVDVIQRSFAGGEIAPALYARADQAKYATGAKTMKNFIPARHGGAVNRPGFEFVCEVKDSTKRVRLLSFVFSDAQTYVLEFGNLYMRVIREGAQLESGGSPYEIATPYLEADLQELRYRQSGDVVTITHPNYAPRELARTGHTAWTLSVITFAPTTARPAGVSVASGGAGSNDYQYQITAVDEDTLQESLPGLDAARNITGITQASPAVVTSAAHGLAAGDEVVIEAVGGMTELNGRQFRVANPTANTFELEGIDSTGYTAYTAGGTAKRTHVAITGAAAPTAANPHVVSWTAVAGALAYNVYRALNGAWGYIGRATGTSFDDTGAATPDTADAPPLYRNPFIDTGNYPSVVGYVQQRLVLANTDNDPEKVWASRSGDYHNYTVRSPVQDDDAISFVPAGSKVNRIRAVLEIGKPIILTEGGEWTAEGDGDGVLRPTAINLRQHSHIGCADLEPQVIGDTALFVQARSSLVYDLRYQFESGGYSGRDLTVFAPHLVDGYTITDMAYQRIPWSVLWAVRSDGVLLGLTYVREHDVWGWHRHTTGASGLFENVAVVPEGDEDALYVVVRRTINGSTKRYIERLHSRFIEDIATDAFFVDSGLSYDGRNTDDAHTMTLTTATTWAVDEDLTLTSSAAEFALADIGNAYHLRVVTPASGDTPESVEILRCTITGYTSPTVVTVRAQMDVPAAFQGVAISDWTRAVDELSGLDHLEGTTVSIMADGHVLAQETIASGAVTLDQPYGVIHLGLPITADLELLDVEFLSSETLKAKRKRVIETTLQIDASRGIWAGPDADHLREYKQRGGSDYDDPIPLQTGTATIKVPTRWRNEAKLLIRQSDPLPLTILGVVRTLDIGRE